MKVIHMIVNGTPVELAVREDECLTDTLRQDRKSGSAWTHQCQKRLWGWGVRRMHGSSGRKGN